MATSAKEDNDHERIRRERLPYTDRGSLRDRDAELWRRATMDFSMQPIGRWVLLEN
ncbi:hypothetical protein TRIUR3_33994 [Triticum urartu]|uniref:Uncharacterized protein n=1 Tax=Triticum urartu TaxID=4572 RepID=M7ZF39_TRIUA|nr:hypothetical protein TRIUR3_33994 [Triticum urartu]